MARLNTNSELIKRLVSVEMFLPQTSTPFDQTTAGSTAKGASVIVVPAITNATNGDNLFIIGANITEMNEINAAPNVNMPLKYKTAAIHPAGARCLEAVKYALGRVEANGFAIALSQSETIIEAADVETPVQTIKGTLDQSFSFSLLGANAQNLLNATGFLDNEAGARTAADPLQSTMGDPNLGLIDIVAFRLTLARFDGATVTFDFTNCSLAPQGEVRMGARSGTSSVPFSGKFSYWIRREWV